MLQLIKYFLVIGLLSVAWGCTEEIDLDLKSANRRLVVEGSVTNEMKMQYVKLSSSIPYLENKPTPAVSGASVVLSDGIRQISLKESVEFPGVYFSVMEFAGVPGRTHVLEISDVDIDGDGLSENYKTSSVMPGIGTADSINLSYSNEWELWKIVLFAQDPPGTQDYYMFRVFKNGKLISGNISEFSIVSDKFFDGNYARGIWVQSLDASEESRPLEEGDVISLQMAGITGDYYRFISAVQQEDRGNYPLFSGPPANVPGNIDNGALGYFAAYAVTYSSVRIGANINNFRK